MEEERPEIRGSIDGGYLTLLSSPQCPDLLSWGTSGQGVTVTIPIHPVTRLRTSGATPPLRHFRLRCEVDEICALLGNYVAFGGNFLPTFRNNLSVARR